MLAHYVNGSTTWVFFCDFVLQSRRIDPDLSTCETIMIVHRSLVSDLKESSNSDGNGWENSECHYKQLDLFLDMVQKCY